MLEEYDKGYRQGFYDCGDRIINWMNSTDSSEMTVKEFRKQLNLFILSIDPNKLNNLKVK